MLIKKFLHASDRRRAPKKLSSNKTYVLRHFSECLTSKFRVYAGDLSCVLNDLRAACIREISGSFWNIQCRNFCVCRRCHTLTEWKRHFSTLQNLRFLLSSHFALSLGAELLDSEFTNILSMSHVCLTRPAQTIDRNTFSYRPRASWANVWFMISIHVRSDCRRPRSCTCIFSHTLCSVAAQQWLVVPSHRASKVNFRLRFCARVKQSPMDGWIELLQKKIIHLKTRNTTWEGY